MASDSSVSSDLEVAVIGNFQIGKSTFVNCLVGRNVAETGRGVSTTHHAVAYPIGGGVSIVDTPGFGAPGEKGGEDEREAREAIRRAFVVIVYLDKTMGTECRALLKEAIASGKRIVVVYNCCSSEKWAPEENDDICRTVAADLDSYGYLDSLVRLGELAVYPLNALWALYGLGLLEDDRKARKIVRYATDDLGLGQDVDLRSEMLRLSNIMEVQRYVRTLPLLVLSDFLGHREREVRRFADRFVEEFTRRLKGGEK